MWRHIAFLAKRVERDAESLWARRDEINGPLPQYIREMFGDVVFLDTSDCDSASKFVALAVGNVSG